MAEDKVAIGFRVIGANDCDDCKSLLTAMDSLKLKYEFMDANADEHQDFCDAHEIDKLPVLQAYNLVSKAIILSREGVVHPLTFFREAVDASKKQYAIGDRRYEGNFKPDGVRRNPYELAKKMQMKQKGCSNCGKRNSSK